jgi:hypothetical protein
MSSPPAIFGDVFPLLLEIPFQQFLIHRAWIHPPPSESLEQSVNREKYDGSLSIAHAATVG